MQSPLLLVFLQILLVSYSDTLYIPHFPKGGAFKLAGQASAIDFVKQMISQTTLLDLIVVNSCTHSGRFFQRLILRTRIHASMLARRDLAIAPGNDLSSTNLSECRRRVHTFRPQAKPGKNVCMCKLIEEGLTHGPALPFMVLVEGKEHGEGPIP